MNTNIILAATLLLAGITVNAQKNSDYNKRAQEVQKEVWDNAPKQFAVKTIPDSMKDESAVVIATSYDVYNTVKGSLSAIKGISFQTTLHQRIKIGDKSALDEYSTIEYEKQIDRSFSGLFFKIRNTINRYIGATIIKPSGKEIIVNTDEEVLTQNEARYKAGKLAISDLQVGDIIDYYIRIEQTTQSTEETKGPYNFFIGGEYPVLYQSIHLVLDDKSSIDYVAANGAPLFKESSDDDNFILSLEKSDIPKRESSMWSSPFRQYPYISIKYTWQSRASAKINHTERGVINHNNASDELVEKYKKDVSNFSASYTAKNLKNMFGLGDLISGAFGGDKEMNNAPADSFLHVFHNAWRYYAFSEFVKKHVNNVEDLTYYSSNSQASAAVASAILRTYDIEHEICLVPSRFGPSKKNILDPDDFEAVLRLHTDKGIVWMGFDDIPLLYNEIPARLQGEDAIMIKPQGNRFKTDFDVSAAKLPEPPASANALIENIHAMVKPAEPTTLVIDRTCTETGAMRHSDQRNLLLTEDIEKTLAAAVKKPGLVDELGDKRKTTGLSKEFDAAFTQDKNNQKKGFEEEIKNQFGQAPKELTAYSIESNGLMNDPLIFKETFTMENFVKKAGNNYIIEAGKLIGSVTDLDEKDRSRLTDVYMFCPRTFTYNISLAIPAGYTVKGLENFNINISNETGAISAAAKQDGDTVILTINRMYNHSKEPVANWQKMLQLIDGMYAVSTQKLLLEKKG